MNGFATKIPKTKTIKPTIPIGITMDNGRSLSLAMAPKNKRAIPQDAITYPKILSITILFPLL